jgi:streptomycin 6-kinase
MASVAALLNRWEAVPDGEPFTTATSILVPARRDGEAVMLKVATAAEEAQGNRLMTWWNGRGSARVLEHDGDAVLLERATGSRSLVQHAESGGAADDAATRILCRVGRTLHEITDPPPHGLTELTEWFRELFVHADTVGGFHARAAAIARDLLADQRDIVVLHGDLHHGNVLDFGTTTHPDNDGWAAIDPKFLIGDRAFDFTNILCNPSAEIAMRPGRLTRQIDVVADASALDRTRLTRWTIAWCGLSSAWSARDGDVSHAVDIGRAAEHLLGESAASSVE